MKTERNAPASLAEALRAARIKRDTLAIATDKLNEKISITERAIAELRLGVTGEYEFEREDPFYKSVLFTKHDRQWRLMWASGSDEHPDGWDEYGPLCQAPRSVRLRAIKALPGLVLEMVEAMDTEIKDVEQRSHDLDRFVAELATSNGPDANAAKAERGGGNNPTSIFASEAGAPAALGASAPPFPNERGSSPDVDKATGNIDSGARSGAKKAGGK